MDVDNDIDQILLHQFSCMGTTDKDDLVKQLQMIVGHQLNSNAASFFLEMNNWNLQGAVGSYFDINSSHKLPSMILIKDVAVSEGECVPPGTKFLKSWHIQNNGTELWPPGCFLQFTGGVCMSHQERIPVVPIAPGSCTCLSIEMTSPTEPGIYQSKWRMCTNSGSYFGDVIWVILTVVDSSLDGLTQQLSHFSDLGSPPRSHNSSGPVHHPSSDKDNNMTC